MKKAVCLNMNFAHSQLTTTKTNVGQGGSAKESGSGRCTKIRAHSLVRWFSVVVRPYEFHLSSGHLGGVYMTPGRLSPRSEFTPVPSHGSIFVYMIPPQNVMPARVTPA